MGLIGKKIREVVENFGWTTAYSDDQHPAFPIGVWIGTLLCAKYPKHSVCIGVVDIMFLALGLSGIPYLIWLVETVVVVLDFRSFV